MTEHLTAGQFRQRVFDYAARAEWEYAGRRPCLVDFYADWCGPCKMISPVLEELSAEYDGRLDVFKVNTDQEPELASVFGVQSIPSLLFIPIEGKPKMSVGMMTKAQLEQAFREVLKV